MLEVTPNMAPFAGTHPHANGYGHYAVPAVNLVRGDPRPGLDFPAWLFLWLPVERQYASYDLDHGDLKFGIDFRSVYAGVLSGWLGVSPEAVLGEPFEPLAILPA